MLQGERTRVKEDGVGETQGGGRGSKREGAGEGDLEGEVARDRSTNAEARVRTC